MISDASGDSRGALNPTAAMVRQINGHTQIPMIGREVVDRSHQIHRTVQAGGLTCQGPSAPDQCFDARVKYFGHQRGWFGAIPPEYHRLKNLDPFEQVAGQVYYINRAVEAGLSDIDTARWLQVEYEQFCMAPEQVFNKIMEKFAQQGCSVDWSYTGPEQFQCANQVRMSRQNCQRIIDAYKSHSGIDIIP